MAGKALCPHKQCLFTALGLIYQWLERQHLVQAMAHEACCTICQYILCYDLAASFCWVGVHGGCSSSARCCQANPELPLAHTAHVLNRWSIYWKDIDGGQETRITPPGRDFFTPAAFHAGDRRVAVAFQDANKIRCAEVDVHSARYILAPLTLSVSAAAGVHGHLLIILRQCKHDMPHPYPRMQYS